MASPEGSNALAAAVYGAKDATDRAEAARSATACGCRRMLPSFLVVGPPRTGTTWMHEVLSRHAHLPSPTKETRFFDRHYDRGLSWYSDHFPSSTDGKPTGEIAPTYFASPAARARIAHILPAAKVVIIFRHPVERLVSLYRLKRAYGLLGWSLEQALERDPELMGSSQYASHLSGWQRSFPGDQLSVNLYEDLSGNPQNFIDGVVDFVGISRFRLHESQQIQVAATSHFTEPRNYLATRAATAMADWCKARKLDNVVASVRKSNLMRLFLGGGAPFPEIPAPTMRRISSLVLPEVERLEDMLGRDLSHWKTMPGC